MRKIIKAVCATALCVVLLTGCSNPTDEVIKAMAEGNVEQAQQVYSEKISDNSGKESNFRDKAESALNDLTEQYNNGTLTEEEIDAHFEAYKELLGSKGIYTIAEKKLNELKASKYLFDSANKFLEKGNLETAYELYGKVDETDANYGAAQNLMKQIEEEIKEEKRSKIVESDALITEAGELLRQGQYKDAIAKNREGYSLREDKEGIGTIPSQVTKKLAEEDGFDNPKVVIEENEKFYYVHIECDSYKGQALDNLSEEQIVKAYKELHRDFESMMKGSYFILGDIHCAGKWYDVILNGCDTVIIRTDSEKQESQKQNTKSESMSNNQAVSQEYKNALSKGLQYANQLHMSKQAIYDQLTSSYGEGFPADAARYAVDNMTGVDWNANALEKAKQYYYDMAMSKSAVYDQLTSSYGEQFTASQAQYAIDHLD